MRTQSEYLEELAGIEPFRGLWRRELSMVAQAVDMLELDEGTVIVEQGAGGHELFLIVEGSATVADENGPTAMLGPSDTIGEVAVISGAPQPATVTAVTPVRLMIIGRRQLLGLLKTVPALSRHLLRGMAARLRGSGGQHGKHSGGRTVAPGVNQHELGKKVSDDPGAATEPRRPLRA